MTEITVLIPVLNRPQRVAPLLDSIEASGRFVRLLPLFLVSPDDDAELAAVDRERETRRRWADGEPVEALERIVVDWPPGPGDYSRKINRGAAWASSEFVFLAADDLRFHPGWAERALACHLETHACVVGTNDGGNRQVQQGHHSTHTLVHRDYLDCGTADEPDSRKLLHEGYSHNFCDSEFVATAKARETWAHATDSLVEHEHPFWGKSARDATYDRGQAGYKADQALFNKRRRLWA